MTTLVLVAVGGGLGAGARWVLWDLAPRPAGFPLGITTVNVLGSLVLGLIVGSGFGFWIVDADALAIGALGGFTTFSTWMVDIDSAGTPARSALVTAVPLVLGLIAAWAGITLGGSVG